MSYVSTIKTWAKPNTGASRDLAADQPGTSGATASRGPVSGGSGRAPGRDAQQSLRDGKAPWRQAG